MVELGWHHVFGHGDRFYLYDPCLNEVYGFDPDTTNVEDLIGSSEPPRLAVCNDCRVAPDTRTDLSHLALTLTEACNLRCRYCSYTHGGLAWQRTHSQRMMSREVMLSALRYFLPRSVTAEHAAVSFYGGEPLLALGLIEEAVAVIEAEACRPDTRVIIDTNGLLLGRPEIVAFIAEHGLHLQVSLDGPRHIHDRHRVGVEDAPSHDQVMAGLRSLLARDPGAAKRLRFQATVVDAGDLDEVARWFADFPPFVEAGIAESPSLGVNLADVRGVDPETLGLPRNHHEARRRAVAAKREDYIEARIAGGEPDPVARALFDGDMIGFYHRSRGPVGETIAPSGFCEAGVRKLHVTVEGNLQPCERVGAGLVIGNVGTGIDSKEASRLETTFVARNGDRCNECWAVRMCTHCATSLVTEGEVPPAVCDSVRDSCEERLRMWVRLVEGGAQATAFLKGSKLG